MAVSTAGDFFSSENWHTKSQGPKKKIYVLKVGGSAISPSHTASNKGSFTPLHSELFKEFVPELYLMLYIEFQSEIDFYCFFFKFQTTIECFTSLSNCALYCYISRRFCTSYLLS